MVCNYARPIIDTGPTIRVANEIRLIPDTETTEHPPLRREDRRETSLHGEILPRLRDYIVEGNIPDGARVPERQLCEMLGISRTPLREALKVLAAEGLIELLPNRGARVRAAERSAICGNCST